MRVELECVVNVSEGRDGSVISDLAAAAGSFLLDLHSDPYHHRSVYTLAGGAAELMEAVQSLSRAAVARLDLAGHDGVHPRLGVLDVVPWVRLQGWPVSDGPADRAIKERDRFAAWAASELGLPCFLYGPERTLPAVRRQAWHGLTPDTGPAHPHPTAGACAAGARPLLVAYNLWLVSADLATARQTAAAIRGPHVRAIGLQVGPDVQVSCNLIAPWQVGPGAAFDAVASRVDVARAELVGLVPNAVLDAEPEGRWAELALDPSRTIEARLEQAGLDGGRFGSHSG
jgi:glutamate formiminotransferase